ncbi:MAG: cyclic nucleotide-binding domain-containing protein [Deltaproteobacteria bacterium]|nr:cyclic nucleotide-binding domain-containing protein [Deltaproteobacteria bacterium]
MLDQSELFEGMGMLFVKDFMKVAITTSYDKGDILFREGDPALYFYTMISGKVNLSIRTGHHVYTISNPGEVFGWSSLVERDLYSATAECVEPALLLRTDKNVFFKMIEAHPNISNIFYKNLSKTLGKRLLASYNVISCALDEKTSPS